MTKRLIDQIGLGLCFLFLASNFAFAEEDCERSNDDPSDFAVTAYQNHECLVRKHLDRVGYYSCTVTEVVSSKRFDNQRGPGQSFSIRISALTGEGAMNSCQRAGRWAQYLTVSPDCGFPFELEKDDGSFAGYKNSSDGWIFEGLRYAGQFILYENGAFTNFRPGGEDTDEIIRGSCQKM